ncbi:MAG: cell division protein ZapA [Clostridium sp.]|nr:cell division protein ZapA [Clostridium sp.]
MESKNYTQVLIDGKIYTLGGSEDEGYLQKAASYVNEKKSQMRKIPGYTKQNADYQTIMMELNITDDYFKAMERAEGMERQKNELEKETYSLKHELVSTQMKLEAVLKDLEERQRELDKLTRRCGGLEGELKEVRQQLKNRNEREPSASSSRVQIKATEEITETLETEHQENQGEESQGTSLQAEADTAREAAATAESRTLQDEPGAEATEELAQKALQAARKAAGRKGGRR